jgi:hypothetical protein
MDKLSALQAYCHIVGRGSFTHAAEDLGVSPAHGSRCFSASMTGTGGAAPEAIGLASGLINSIYKVDSDLVLAVMVSFAASVSGRAEAILAGYLAALLGVSFFLVENWPVKRSHKPRRSIRRGFLSLFPQPIRKVCDLGCWSVYDL